MVPAWYCEGGAQQNLPCARIARLHRGMRRTSKRISLIASPVWFDPGRYRRAMLPASPMRAAKNAAPIRQVSRPSDMLPALVLAGSTSLPKKLP